MTPEERKDLIAQYYAGYDEAMNALNGFLPIVSVHIRFQASGAHAR